MSLADGPGVLLVLGVLTVPVLGLGTLLGWRQWERRWMGLLLLLSATLLSQGWVGFLLQAVWLALFGGGYARLCARHRKLRRAGAGAVGLFAVALLHLVSAGDWPGESPLRTVFLLACFGAVALLLQNELPEWFAARDAGSPQRLAGGGLLIGALAATLWAVWEPLYETVAQIQPYLRLGSHIGYGGIPCMALPPGDAVLGSLGILAFLVGCLGVFQLLWDRLMRGAASEASGSGQAMSIGLQPRRGDGE